MDQGEGCGHGEKQVGLKDINVGIEWDLMICWIQGDRALSGCGGGVLMSLNRRSRIVGKDVLDMLVW